MQIILEIYLDVSETIHENVMGKYRNGNQVNSDHKFQKKKRKIN